MIPAPDVNILSDGNDCSIPEADGNFLVNHFSNVNHVLVPRLGVFMFLCNNLFLHFSLYLAIQIQFL